MPITVTIANGDVFELTSKEISRPFSVKDDQHVYYYIDAVEDALSLIVNSLLSENAESTLCEELVSQEVFTRI